MKFSMDANRDDTWVTIRVYRHRQAPPAIIYQKKANMSVRCKLKSICRKINKIEYIYITFHQLFAKETS